MRCFNSKRFFLFAQKKGFRSPKISSEKAPPNLMFETSPQKGVRGFFKAALSEIAPPIAPPKGVRGFFKAALSEIAPPIVPPKGSGFRPYFKAPWNLPMSEIDAYLVLQFQNCRKELNPPGENEIPSPFSDGITVHGVYFYFAPYPVVYDTFGCDYPALTSFSRALDRLKIDKGKLHNIWPNINPRNPDHAPAYHDFFLWRSESMKHMDALNLGQYMNLGIHLFEIVEETGVLNEFPTRSWIYSSDLQERVKRFPFYMMLELCNVNGVAYAKQLWFVFQLYEIMRGNLVFVGYMPKPEQGEQYPKIFFF